MMQRNVNNVYRCSVVWLEYKLKAVNKRRYQRKVLVLVFVVCFSLAVCGICPRLYPFL